MKEIYIYGDIVPFKWFNDGSEYDLQDLNNALASVEIAEGEELIVNIHTFGGCTLTAFGIYNKLRRFKNERKIKLTTRIDGYCASAGVSIFLAGDRRIGNAYAEPFVHNAWTWAWDDLDKKKASKIAEDLTKTDNQIATLYADRTEVTVDQALALMDADTWLTADQCMEYKFFTELETDTIVVESEMFNSLRGKRKSNNNFNTDDMSKDKKTLMAAVNKFLGIKTKNKIVYTATNEELDFYELEEDATPAVGDKATFAGEPAGDSNEGTYLVASGETYKFTGEELTEIVAATEDAPEDENALATENAALKEEINALKAEQVTNKLTIKNLKAENATAKNLVKQFADMSADDEEDEQEEDENTPKPRDKNSNKDTAPLTRNLFAGIK